MKHSPLSAIRSSLAGLRRRRAASRISAGLFAVLIATAGLIVLLFALDVFFHFSRVERIGLLAGFASLAAWCGVRWLLPALTHRESEVQLALWIERDHPELRGTLASALQFASVEPGTWGSSALEQATVTEIARLDRLPPVADPHASRCARLALVGVFASVAIAWSVRSFPEVCQIFASRLLLGDGTYPTKTVISRIEVNGTQVLPAPDAQVAARIPVGEALEISVECRGVLPERGTVHVQTQATGQGGALVLTPDSKGCYSASGNRLLEDTQLQVRIGDAVTESLKIEAVPLPIVSIEISAELPEYVRGGGSIQRIGSPPQISVPAGSRTEFTVQCRNKGLRSATLRIGTTSYSLEQKSDDGHSWELASHDTPLAEVVSPLEYELSIVDRDGLSLREPMHGVIGVLRDEAPRVALNVATLHVLPQAEPTFQWTASDDHDVERVDLHWQLTGEAGSREDSISLYHRDERAPKIPSLHGTGRLPLTPLDVKAGAEIRLTIVAIDNRGRIAGVEGTSEPVILHVTDKAGILAALSEGDHKAAAELDELIERQLRSGAGP